MERFLTRHLPIKALKIVSPSLYTKKKTLVVMRGVKGAQQRRVSFVIGLKSDGGVAGIPWLFFMQHSLLSKNKLSVNHNQDTGHGCNRAVMVSLTNMF